MSDNSTSSEQITSKLIEMGFDNSAVIKALEAVGPSLDDAIEQILNGHHKNCKGTANSSKLSTNSGSTLGKKAFPSTSSVGQKRQSTILDHFRTPITRKRSKANAEAGVMVSGSALLPSTVIEHRETYPTSGFDPKPEPKALPVGGQLEVDIKSGWELKASSLLQKHFGYLSLKNFQKEALSTWLARKDCLVLAATGSGKSLCFQIPALLTGQIVVVISPLISLMHDQCSKLSKLGISACYLGSGQPDTSVELKAMRGMYSIIYVCPETLLRLIKPMQELAESHGIALFAIDEVHCVSKWGHDFRPDYRRLSVLRENFSTKNLKFLKFDIPLMALTATATTQVQEDILQSLHMSTESKIVRTSLFRPNLQFSVKHSKTSSQSSYGRDFHQLIDIYNGSRKITGKEKTTSFHELDNQCDNSASSSMSLASETDPSYNIEDDELDEDESDSGTKNVSHVSREKKMSVEYLENDADVFLSANDWDVACGEFHGDSQGFNKCGSAEAADQSSKSEKRLGQLPEPLEQGPTIIYVPTRKETLSIAKFLCGFGVKAAAYNASLPKSHLRRVHKEFHENVIEVVVATIAFGMGIDKLNVRRIIHYGWPQSLEAYYQEAGRAGRDGKLADCILYADLSRVPTLLPSKRSEDQTRQAYQMLSDCFRYGMNTSCCRAKILVEYFGEDFSRENCLVCDVCVSGPPAMQNLKEEANVLMQVIAAYNARIAFEECSYDDVLYTETKPQKFMEKPNLRTFVSKIREQSKKFLETDLLWWRGFARILENKGFIRESDNKIHVQIKFPEPTNHGLEFLQSENDQTFNVYPEADMLLSMEKPKSYSSFSEWGKGWADPEIRRQRLESKRSSGKQAKRWKSKKRKSRKSYGGFTTARSRLSAKLSKKR